jgi:hypothetical protein
MQIVKHGFEKALSKEALDMLLIDRRNEFRELERVIFSSVPTSTNQIIDWEIFILNFCLDVNTAFKTWSGQEQLVSNSSIQALTIVRQLSKGKSTMNELTHLLNISYTLAEEFKEIYKRLK